MTIVRLAALALLVLVLPACAARPVRESQADQQFALGNYKLARALYREAIRVDPHSDRIWAKYDLAYLREMASDSAQQAVAAAVSIAASATVAAIAASAPIAAPLPAGVSVLGPAVAQEVAANPPHHEHKFAFAPLAPRLGGALGAPMSPASLSLRRTQPLEPAVDLPPPPERETSAPPPGLPRIPGQRELPEDGLPVTGARTEAGVAAEAARAQGLVPEGTPPSQQAPEPPSTANPVPNVTTLAPSEVLPVGQPTPGDPWQAVTGSRGEPLVVRGVGWDVWDLRYGVDLAGRPHVLGRLRNLAPTNLVNPTVNVGLLEPAGVQVAFKPVRLINPSGVLFPGQSDEFDAEFPNQHNVIAGFRLFTIRP